MVQPYNSLETEPCLLNPTPRCLLNRRQFIQLAATAVATMAITPWGDVLAAALPANTLSFAVMSDLHYYAPELGTTSTAFQRWQDKTMKLLSDSKAIVTSAVTTIAQSDAQIVLVPGDLTKDGERLCHEQVAALLGQLTASGKKVYVVPGNHDIYNPNAWDFTTETPTLAANISPDDFKTIYGDFGYKQAIATDAHSLSYVVEPFPGLRILAMDDCLYCADNLNIPGTEVDLANHPWAMGGAAFSPNTLSWLKQQIRIATAQGITIIGMMHHSLVPHFSLESTISNSLAVADCVAVGEALCSQGLQLVFTGHLHTQNVSQATYKSKTLIDIETGSLVTYPLPIRFVQMDGTDSTWKIATQVVASAGCSLAPAWDGMNYLDLQTYAKNYLAQLEPVAFVQQFSALFQHCLSPESNTSLSAPAATALARQLAQLSVGSAGPTLSLLYGQLMIASCQGDYLPDDATKNILVTLASSEDPTYGPYLQIVGNYLCSMARLDVPLLLGDNKLTICLQSKTGLLSATG